MSVNNVDKQYINLVKNILTYGSYKETRAGSVLSTFGNMMHFNLQDGLPILTTKKVFTKGVIHELLWFLKGSTNIKYLVENNVNIWNDDAYRWYKSKVETHNKLIINDNLKINPKTKEEFIQSVLNEDSKLFVISDSPMKYFSYTYGDLGNVYGNQWRNKVDSNGIKIDQIQNIINTLKTNPNDRRMLCVAYSPTEVGEMALPPCHTMFQFYTKPLTWHERLEAISKNTNKYDEWKNPKDETLDELNAPKYKLSCMWSQRSCDVGLGFPFNLLSYSILTYMIAQCVNMVPDEIICSLGDTHIYENHIDGLKEQIEREPFDKLPKLVLNPNITDIDSFTFDDIKIEDYQCHDSIKLPLSVG